MNTVSLHELGFGPGLARHLLNHTPASLLGFRCQPPYYWRSSTISGRPIFPLWECGTMLAYFHREAKLFERCSLEDIDAVWVKYKSAQALMADLLVDLYEDELTDDELRVTAETLGFKHIERFITEIGAHHGGGYAKFGTFERWREQFCASYG